MSDIFSNKQSPLLAHDPETWMETIWDALHSFREHQLPEGDDQYDEQWDDICTAMAWIEESFEAFPEAEKKEPEIQTYNVSTALKAYAEGYAVYIAHPLPQDPDERLTSYVEIARSEDHLFVIKENVVESE